MEKRGAEPPGMEGAGEGGGGARLDWQRALLRLWETGAMPCPSVPRSAGRWGNPRSGTGAVVWKRLIFLKEYISVCKLVGIFPLP